MGSDLLRELGKWGDYLSTNGRLLFEIIGWYDNDSKQFYAYELQLLESEYCTVERNNIIYNAPISFNNNNKATFKKVKIAKKKCIIIEFPLELGGYKNFKNKVNQVRKLGDKHSSFNPVNPEESLNRMKLWDKNFNKIVSDWGSTNNSEDITEFYTMLNAFKFTNTAVLCTNEIIDGLKQLIVYLNGKLLEDAKVEFDIENYDRNYYKTIQDKWLSGKLSFEDGNKLLRP